MDSVKSDKPLIYANIQQRIYVNPEDFVKRERDDSRYQKKLYLANMSDDEIDLASRRRAYKGYVNDPVRVGINAACLCVPFVHSIAKGLFTKGTTAQKTGVTLKTAKNWGLFIVGAFVFSKSVDLVLGNDKPSKDFVKNHPVLSLTSMFAGSIAVGNMAIRYGNKVLSRLLKNKDIDVKIAESLEKSSAMRNKTYGKVVTKLSDLANGKAGDYVKRASLIGMTILAVKPFFDIVKLNNRISESKENLKQKRYKASRDMANELWVRRNEPNPFKTEVQGIVVFSNKNPKLNND